MGWPTSPTNGQQANVNGVVYTYSSTLGAWTVTTSTGANISAGNITVTGTTTGTTFSATGNVVAGNLSTTGSFATNAILNTGGNGFGNIGNSSGYFNTVFAKATSAQYADLAEVYESDADYEPGTVLSFGGSGEVTVSTVPADPKIAGVVSTNPSYIMNATLESEHVAIVALTGRVPTKVTGRVHKGDMMVSNGDGTARAEPSPRIGTIIGKAISDFDGDKGMIEIVVGRL